MKRVGKNSILFDNVYVLETATSTGPREKKGPIGEYIDKDYDNLNCLEKSWEKAECRLQKDVIEISLKKAALEEKDLDLIVSGDLNNQIVVSSFTAKDYDIPHIGIYGACTTSILSLIVGSNYIDTKTFNNVLCLTSSHYATSEKQFRFPTEYGGQKPDTTTTTVTGSGATIITNQKTTIKITKATIGKVIDAEYKDAQDLGKAMAPSAAVTLKQHISDFNIPASYYDLILTGDLSLGGSKVFIDILKEWDIIIPNYNDCGLMIYDLNNQEVFSGGSGCGCAGVVVNSYIMALLRKKILKKVLVITTGALMNPISTAQKESIPGIAHAVAFEVVE